MPNIMLLATAWGSKYGGINAFNMDFAYGLADHLQYRGNVFCAVLNASTEEYEDAIKHGVKLLSINKPADRSSYDSSWAHDVWKYFCLKYPGNRIDWWVGHDIISGTAAVEGPSVSQSGQSAVIMHMSYSDYATYKHGIGLNAVKKEQQQRDIFRQAQKHFAVGPLLRDAMRGMVDNNVTMLVPGFANIAPASLKANLTQNRHLVP